MDTTKFKTITLLKKNRKYFAASIDGYKCRVVIDENSQDLELGEHDLEVNDLSVKTKYGTDLVFSVVGVAAKLEPLITLKHPHFNKILVRELHRLNCKWNVGERAWMCSPLVEDKIDELDFIFNSQPIKVEVSFKEEVFAPKSSFYFLGRELAGASGRDSGASIGSGVALLAGTVTSGGSMKNWGTVIREGSVFRLELPKELLIKAGVALGEKDQNGFIQINYSDVTNLMVITPDV